MVILGYGFQKLVFAKNGVLKEDVVSQVLFRVSC